MTTQDSITTIQQAETEAEEQIKEAGAKAREKTMTVEQGLQTQISELKDSLTDERTKLADKVQKEAQVFKDSAATELKKDLAGMEEGKDARISTAANNVTKSFQDYVSE